MRANLMSIKKQRRYSEDFKRRIVKNFESGRYSVMELERLHGVTNNSIYKWVYKYSTFSEKGYRIVEMKQSSQKKVNELQAQVKVGRRQFD